MAAIGWINCCTFSTVVDSGLGGICKVEGCCDIPSGFLKWNYWSLEQSLDAFNVHIREYLQLINVTKI